MLAIRPALSSWLDAVRRSEASTPVADARIQRFEQPVHKVVRLPRHRDSFEGSTDLKQQNLQQPSAFNATPAPKPGAMSVTQLLQRDAFESATRKPVELTPKPPPSFKPAVAIFRFR
jgi:hypothetical protein